MKGKHFMIATLIALILLIVAFTPISSQQVGTYDPWADINDDGKIDIRDIAYSARLFGTTGDPTKNVNVTNWPLDAYGNLKVGIARPLGKYGDVLVYVTNFPRDAFGNLKVNITNWQLMQNVNVTNWPSSQDVNIVNWPLDEQGNLKMTLNHKYISWRSLFRLNQSQSKSFVNDTVGYKEIHLTVTTNGNAEVLIKVKYGSIGWVSIYDFLVFGTAVKTYPAPGVDIKIVIKNLESWAIYAQVVFYMIT